jgi:UDP-galactopyranose mutase
MKKKILIVGSGFAGAVSARVLADSGFIVQIIDKRNHVGGNAYDFYDKQGVLIHPYGPHIFHTNSKKIFDFLSNFTSWRFYEHRVLAKVNNSFYPIPINRTTINTLYNKNYSEIEIKDFYESVREKKETINSSEDVVLNSVGKDLCEKFFKGYTKKQWGLELSELSAGVAARIPTRSNDDDRYFTDTYQYMPKEGYHVLFNNLLDHKNIEVKLNVDFFEERESFQHDHLIYTGPIDKFFNYKHGKLPYRSLIFNHEFINTENFQQTGTVNYPNDEEFTRITEFKYLTGQVHTGTSIVREYPSETGDPYYPIPREGNEKQYQLYKSEAEKLNNITFLGRLAQYRYYNMDQVVGSALTASEKIINLYDY